MGQSVIIDGPPQASQYAERVAALGAGFGGVGQFGNICSIADLPPGVWLLTGVIDVAVLALLSRVVGAISVNSANTTTDHQTGRNARTIPQDGVALTGGGTIAYKLTLTQPTTVYLKAAMTGAIGDCLTGSLTATPLPGG